MFTIFSQFWVISDSVELCKANLAVFIDLGSIPLDFCVMGSPKLTVLLAELVELTAFKLQMLEVIAAFGCQDAIWIFLAIDTGLDKLP